MTGPLPDRRVHAEDEHIAVVRYERAGKWFVENRDGSDRTALDVRQAADIARNLVRAGGRANLGIPGGRTFDRLYRGIPRRR